MYFFNQRAESTLTRKARFCFYDVQGRAAFAAPSGDLSPLGSKVSIDTFELLDDSKRLQSSYNGEAAHDMIRLIDVYKEYDNGTKALKGIDLRIEDGEFVFLVGPSGSGKSTIVKLLTAESTASKGRVIVNGYNLNNIRRWQIPHMRRTLGVIFQDFRLIEKKTVQGNLEFAMRTIGASGREMRKRIPYVLDLVGLNGKADAFPNEMSGGEQQRVAIARALVNNPRMIIADEPTGNLDPKRSLEIMTLLERINSMGTTVLVVTHEKDLVNRFSKRVVAIKDGELVRDGQGGYYRV